LFKKNGIIVAERYGDNFNRDTPQLGWSMTKSVLNILYGVLIQQRKASLTDLIKSPEWTEPNDRRNNITLDVALRMSTGLEFNENYVGITDVSLMLFNSSSTGKYASNKRLEFPIDTAWKYSSGTSNILGRKARSYFTSNEEYWKFARDHLFDPLGIDKNGIMQVDTSGHWIASSFSYFTTRDWAKMAQLFLNDGVWNGRRIIPAGWAKYSSTATPRSNGVYGAHWWILRNVDNSYSMTGYEGQFNLVNQNNNIVITRHGLTRVDYDYNKFFNEIINSLK